MASEQPDNDRGVFSDEELTEDLIEWKEWAEKWLTDIQESKEHNEKQ